MADPADVSQKRMETEEAMRDRARGETPYEPPAGKPGDCELCGFWSRRLIGGACPPCRDRYGLP